ncbi:MAG TPA: hypothetical protein VLC73_01325 [Burkholderiales bacterium]|nr:hypothetical protein [Burkholderiales bacterium]
MAIESFTSARWQYAAGLCGLLAAFLASCAVVPGDKERRDAVIAINKAFRADYEAILAENGTRVFNVTRAEAYDAVRVSMARLGMTVEAQDPVLGYVNVYAPAPRPLSDEEWEKAAAADLPRTREIIGPHVGIFRHFFSFNPKGLQTVISATVVQAPAGAEISFTARMREIAPPESDDYPRREYLPPTAVRMALDKMWAEVEREFKATVRRP